MISQWNACEWQPDLEKIVSENISITSENFNIFLHFLCTKFLITTTITNRHNLEER